MRRRSRFVGNGEENAAAEGSFQSKPPEYTAVAKPFPKEICEPARRKILDQAKFLSKGMFMGCWGKVPMSYSLKTKFFVILSEVEESHNSKRKAISLWFFMRLTKKISCFDYAEHEDYANAT